MYQTTYMVEFQPPHLREENFICRKKKKLGKKHFPDEAAVKELGKRLTYVEHGPALIDACECEPKTDKDEGEKDEVSNSDAEAEAGGDQDQKRRCSTKLPEFLYHIEWTPLNIMGRVLSPKLIPTKMTPEQEKLLMDMLGETEKICLPTEEDNAEDKSSETGSSNEQPFKVIEGFTPQPVYKKYVADACRTYCRH